jgi:hypothetical protein
MRLMITISVVALTVATPAACVAQPMTIDPSLASDPVVPRPDPSVYANLGEARRFLEEVLRPQDPERYLRLNGPLSHLESMNDAADGVLFTGLALTLGSFGTGVGLAVAQEREMAAAMLTAAGVALVAGMLIQALFRPSGDDVRAVFAIP